MSKACKIVNDWVKTRLPIYYQLLEIPQPTNYLCITYQSILMLGYYGLLRIGELTSGDHPILACNVHMAKNKNKLMLVLFSSKTHSVSDPPQKIKISGINNKSNCRKHFCPFNTTREYMRLRGDYLSTKEPFYIFQEESQLSQRMLEQS